MPEYEGTLKVRLTAENHADAVLTARHYARLINAAALRRGCVVLSVEDSVGWNPIKAVINAEAEEENSSAEKKLKHFNDQEG
jgi:hypothetical protein